MINKTWTIIDDNTFTSKQLWEIDHLINKAQYLRLEVVQPYTNTLNTKDSESIYIEGLATGGSINVDGKSAVRRTGSLSMIVNYTNLFDVNNNELTIGKITQLKNPIAIDKEIKVYMGIEDLNNPGEIYAFKLGWFVIKTASITRNLQGLTLSVSLSDLMSRLNGDVGGTLSNPITHSPEQIWTGQKDKDGIDIYDSQPALFETIIATLVQEFGNLKDHQIICEGFPTKIKNTVHWSGERPVYTWKQDSNFNIGIYPPGGNLTVDEYNTGDSLGYQMTDFVYPGELSSNAGDTIVSVLDKVKNTLGGTYEYFFDVDGNFRFQPVQNHLNDGSAEINISDALVDKHQQNYLYKAENDSFVKYHFKQDETLITSYQNAPKWEGIKNDITLWGKGGNGSPVWMHLTIGPKYETAQTSWDIDRYKINDVWIYCKGGEYPKDVKDLILDTDIFKNITPLDCDWRTQLCIDYILGVIPADKSWEKAYGKELESSWPRVFDLAENIWIRTTVENGATVPDRKWANNLSYFFDRIDPDDFIDDKKPDDVANLLLKQKFTELSIPVIGKRPKVLNNDKVNTIFNPLFPNYVYVIAGQGDTEENRRKALEELQSGAVQGIIQVSRGLGAAIDLQSTLKPAYDAIRSELHEITSYNETISLSSIPIFHLEPNILIYVEDDETGIKGNYTLNSFNIPFDLNGTMNLSCSKALERI